MKKVMGMYAETVVKDQKDVIKFEVMIVNSNFQLGWENVEEYPRLEWEGEDRGLW